MTNTDPHNPPPSDPLAVMLPRATRFRRKLVWGSLGVAGAALAGVLAYGFLHSPSSSVAKKGEVQNAANQKPQHPDMGSFPQDYSQIKPVQAAAVPSAAPAATSTQPAAPKSNQPTEEDKARASNVFFPQAAAAQNLAPATGAAPSPVA